MYFNLRNKFVKRKKIRKTFVNLLNFAWDDAGFALAAFHNVSNRFQNTNLQFHWLSGNTQTCTPMRLRIRVLKSV